MNTSSENRLPQVTRWLVYIIMALIGFVMVALALGSVILPFYWDKVVIEIAKEHPTLEATALMPRLYAIFALGLLMMGMVMAIMRKLLAMINSVELGDPFVNDNADRLTAIGWLMVTLQVLAFPLALLASDTADLFGKNDVGIDFSLNGVLAILLVFILADVFRRGTAMREELEGTV